MGSVEGGGTAGSLPSSWLMPAAAAAGEEEDGVRALGCPALKLPLLSTAAGGRGAVCCASLGCGDGQLKEVVLVAAGLPDTDKEEEGLLGEPSTVTAGRAGEKGDEDVRLRDKAAPNDGKEWLRTRRSEAAHGVLGSSSAATLGS